VRPLKSDCNIIHFHGCVVLGDIRPSYFAYS
jgi:hypothetical protein